MFYCELIIELLYDRGEYFHRNLSQSTTVEGISSLTVAIHLAKKHNLHLPILFSIELLLQGREDLQVLSIFNDLFMVVDLLLMLEFL